MLSYLRGHQPIEAQANAAHPGSHHPGDHPLLLSGDHRLAICSRSGLHYADFNRNDYFHANLYLYANRVPDFDIHPGAHHHGDRNKDSQCDAYIYLHLHSAPPAHFYAKRDSDSDIHTHSCTNINFNPDFDIYRQSPPANPH
jgi:hypothetical protein